MSEYNDIHLTRKELNKIELMWGKYGFVAGVLLSLLLVGLIL